ncbi:unnamed protein product [Arabidopsis halleri]
MMLLLHGFDLVANSGGSGLAISSCAGCSLVPVACLASRSPVRVAGRVGIVLFLQVVALLREGRSGHVYHLWQRWCGCPLIRCNRGSVRVVRGEFGFGAHVVEDARRSLGFLDGARGVWFPELWLSFTTPKNHREFKPPSDRIDGLHALGSQRCSDLAGRGSGVEIRKLLAMDPFRSLCRNVVGFAFAGIAVLPDASGLSAGTEPRRR